MCTSEMSLLGEVNLVSFHFSIPPGHISVPFNNKGDGTFLLYKSYFRLHSYKETEKAFLILNADKTKAFLFVLGIFLLSESSILKYKHTFSSVTGIFRVPGSSIRLNFLKSYQI